MKIRRKSDDDAFSLAVRWRAGWRCQRCYHTFPVGAQNLHCSHIFGRRHATRFDPMNAVALCAACHFFFTENPVEHTRWAERYMGIQQLESLRVRAHRVTKSTRKYDRAAATKHFREEAKRFEEYWDSVGFDSYAINGDLPELKPYDALRA